MTNISNMNSNYNNMEPYSYLVPNNGGSTSDNSMETQSHLPRVVRRNIISAASSIASGNSAKTSSSVSTFPSAASTTMGSAAAGGSIAIKNLLQMNNQQQQDSTTTKNNTNDNSSAPSQPSDQTTVVTNISSSSYTAPSAAASNQSTTTTTSPSFMLGSGPPHPIAEFLFQLTKMLTDNNTTYIEWRDGSIVVHDPPGVERDILPKYFRHSNYSSFQRQMNYFGFRKIAGKGKMAPCSYENEKATKDISSLLFIKRKKAGMSAAAAKLIAQQKNLRMLEKAKLTGSSGLNPSSLGLMGGAAGLHIQQVQQLQANQQLQAQQANQQLQAAQLQAAHLQAAQLQAQLQEEQKQLQQVKLPFASASLPLNLHQAVAAQDINNLVSSRNISSLDMQAASLLNTQQTMLAQLQQAHANALNSNPPILDHGGISQQLQQPSQSTQAANTGMINNGNWSNNDAQSLLHQAGLSAQNSLGGISRSYSPDNLVRIDSAASLRALLNQQICMYNTTGEPHAIGQGSMAFQQEGGDGEMTTSIQGNANTQGLLTFDLNDIFNQTQQTGEMGSGGSVVNNTDTALQHFQQHLLQQGGNDNGAYSDLYGPGGGSCGGGAQGY